MLFEEQLRQYVPCNIQESTDRAVIMNALTQAPDIYARSNLVYHVTASSWITNRTRNKILMIYHNIYDSWAWTGGHADEERDLLSVSIREACEETGLKSIKPLSEDLFSIETLTVNPHVRKGVYVPAHLHLNATYLLEADEAEPLHHKEDENKAAAWFSLEEAVSACSEPWMRPVYEKLNKKLLAFVDAERKAKCRN